MKARVSLLRCSSYDNSELKRLLKTSLLSIDCLGRFKDKRVLLKVNLNKAAASKAALNTHPEFVRAVVQVIKEYGGIPIVGDSSALLGLTGRALDASGIRQVAREERIELINFDAAIVMRKEIPGRILKYLYLPKLMDAVDMLVTLPKLKVHDLMLFSGAVKNQMGLLVGATKCKVHELASGVGDLADALIDINSAVKFGLAIMDGIVGLEAAERTRKAGIIAASADLVALDSVCSYLIGLNPLEVLTNRIGQERGLGISDLNNIEVIGDRIEECAVKFKRPGFQIKRNPLIAKLIYRTRGNFIRPRIIKDKCDRCGKCAEVCPVAAIAFNPLPVIGRDCIRCYCCYENCPSGAIRLSCKWYLKPILKKKAQLECDDIL